MFDSPAIVACLDDVTVMCDTIEQCGCHLLVAKGQIGGDEHRGPLIEMR